MQIRDGAFDTKHDWAHRRKFDLRVQKGTLVYKEANEVREEHELMRIAKSPEQNVGMLDI